MVPELPISAMPSIEYKTKIPTSYTSLNINKTNRVDDNINKVSDSKYYVFSRFS